MTRNTGSSIQESNILEYKNIGEHMVGYWVGDLHLRTIVFVEGSYPVGASDRTLQPIPEGAYRDQVVDGLRKISLNIHGVKEFRFRGDLR